MTTKRLAIHITASRLFNAKYLPIRFFYFLYTFMGHPTYQQYSVGGFAEKWNLAGRRYATATANLIHDIDRVVVWKESRHTRKGRYR